MNKSKEIIGRLQDAGIRYWAGDNISEVLQEGDKEQLIEEATLKFEQVLDSLVIDRHNDPNSMDTGRRLAKMYFNEIMAGRYDPMPNATAFPNHVDDGYKGMLVVRSEIKACVPHIAPSKWCSLHWYHCSRTHYRTFLNIHVSTQWCARRGTLQEELNNVIANEIQKATGSSNVGVYLQATHGCCENRGIGARSSLTQTTVLRGAFNEDMGTKKEFMDNTPNYNKNLLVESKGEYENFK